MNAEAAALDPHEWTRQLLAHFRSPRYQPPLLPVIAVEIMALSQQREASTQEIVDVLGRDPLLAAQVLARAQSSAYTRGQATRTLLDAVMKLGLRVLRNIVFEVSLNTRVFMAPAGYVEAMERLRVHSVATGHLANLVAKHTNHPDDFAFLAGLLHDVGVAGLFIAQAELPDPPPLNVAWPGILQHHAEASGALARLWRLPKPLQAVLANHHSVTIEGQPSTLAATIVLAERLAFELAPLVGTDPSTPDRPRIMPGKDLSATPVVQQACRLLGVDGPGFVALREAAREVIARVC